MLIQYLVTHPSDNPLESRKKLNAIPQWTVHICFGRTLGIRESVVGHKRATARFWSRNFAQPLQVHCAIVLFRSTSTIQRYVQLWPCILCLFVDTLLEAIRNAEKTIYLPTFKRSYALSTSKCYRFGAWRPKLRFANFGRTISQRLRCNACLSVEMLTPGSRQ